MREAPPAFEFKADWLKTLNVARLSMIQDWMCIDRSRILLE
jgi:hypothetical protein